MTINDYQRLSMTMYVSKTLQRLSKTINDYQRLLKTTKNYWRLSKTFEDYRRQKKVHERPNMV